MRTFETVLICVNVLALMMVFRKRSRPAWVGVVGINLFVLLLHGVYEGFRYQMAFSYLFVLLLGVTVLIRIAQRSEARLPKVLQIFIVGGSLFLLGVTVFLAYTLPVFTLPRPTGSEAVGIQYLHLVDKNRTDPFVEGSTKKRELMVKIYYPAKEDVSRPFSPYFHGSAELIRYLTSGYGMPVFLFDHLALVKTHEKETLQLSDGEKNYPVVLFSHGAGTTMETQTSQSEDLASHGYIVVAIDHPYVSAATVFPDHIIWSREATTEFNTADPARIITQIMADDAEFVIQSLEDLNEGKPDSIFKGRLNLEEMGYVGHSVGGAVAYNLAVNDHRIKAAIDLDGTVYISPQENKTDIAPFLMLANDKYHVQAIQSHRTLMKKWEELDDVDRKINIDLYGSQEIYQQAYDEAQQNMIGLVDVLKSDQTLFTIEGSDHMKFTDIGLFFGLRPVRELIGIGGTMEPARCLEITKALTLTFFNQHLKGDTNDSFVSLLQRYPELKRIYLQ